MEQTRALNALEPFLMLSKSASSPRAAADLITQATSATNTYVFAELLATPNIQALRGHAEYGGFYKLLEIFAWGTWEEYHATPDLPPLSEQQQTKLRLLSLLPLATSHATLTYPALIQSLSLPDSFALESLLTTALYIPLITGHLDPKNQRIHITSVLPLRDLSPGSIPMLQKTLLAWSHNCSTALQDLEAQAELVKSQAREREERRRVRERAVDKAIEKDDGKAGGAKRGVEGEEDPEAMEGVEGAGSGDGKRQGLRSAKKGGLGGIGGLVSRRLG